MRILITGGASRLAHAIADELRDEHSLRLMDDAAFEPPEKAAALRGNLLNPDDAWRAVRGMDAVIHTGDPPPGVLDDGVRLGLATRGTHVLLKAAVEAGVKRVVYAGTLEVFAAYPDDVYISELWKPLPAPEMGQMSRYLGELTCREFARDYPVTVTCLRLGRLVREEEVSDRPPDPMWLDLRDAGQAFRRALGRDQSCDLDWPRRWAVYHVCADIPNPKYLSGLAATNLGYQPAHNFR